jgi:hypothetical protein
MRRLLLRYIGRLACGLALLGAISARAMTCATCGSTIRGSYITAEERAYCSQGCYRQSRPKCSQCGKALIGRHLVSDGKRFCSQACFDKVLPVCTRCGRRSARTVVMAGQAFCPACAAGPKCSSCQLPYAKPRSLPDGRRLCQACAGAGVFQDDQAAPLFALARQEFHALTGTTVSGIPAPRLVGLPRLQSMLKGQYAGTEQLTLRGFYDRHETVTTQRRGAEHERRRTHVEKTVYLLYGLLPADFIATAVHELTHDWLAEHHKAVGDAPLWVQEGICQYAAATVCRRRELADALRAIEASPDPVYGDGYRYFAVLMGKDNWPGVEAWLVNTALDRLPAQPPASGR